MEGIDRLLTHASAWHPDPRTASVQLTIAELTAATLKAPAGAWGLALVARQAGVILEPLAIAAVTPREVLWLTPRLLRTLPELWVHGGQMRVRLETLIDAAELEDEPLVCMRVRILGCADAQCDPPRDAVFTARDLAQEGMLFISAQVEPPYGWPR